MPSWPIAVVVAVLYGAALFWFAHAGERPQFARVAERHGRAIFGLALAVYCTSWTFYGAVGTAVSSGWQFLPIYLGPILLFTLFGGLVERVLQTGKAQHSTSIADFLSARYGKSAWVAALVTLTALFGALPYMALQLKSVSQTLTALTPQLNAYLSDQSVVVAVAISMAAFAVLFGTGQLDLTRHNRGLVLAIALEAVVKLVALLAVAGFAVLLLLSATSGADVSRVAASSFSASQFNLRFAILTVISASAVLLLPRQFHMLVVEAREDRLAGSMRWLFPAYLVLVCAGIVPVALAGSALLPAGSPADQLLLNLPLAFDKHWLAVLAFIGGFSASTGMIIVTSIALSSMITTDLVIPALFRGQMRKPGDRRALAPTLITIRRATVVGLLALAYFYYRAIGSQSTLAGLGEIAFAGAAQFAPGLLFGFYWHKANRAGMVAGLLGGFAVWLLLLGLPVFGPSAIPLVIGSDPLVSGVLLSLGINVALFVLFSLATEPNLQDKVQAIAFVDRGMPDLGEARFVTKTRVADFRLLIEQLAGVDAARDMLNRLRLESGRNYRDPDPVDAALLAASETQISAVIGSSSARALIQSTLEGDPVSLEHVVAMFDETSQRLQFGAGLLQIAIENIDQGIAVVDGQQQLVAWNRRYVDMFGLPPELVEIGRPIADLLRFNLRNLGVPEAEIDHEVAKRLGHLRRGIRYSAERELADGRVLRVLGNAAPNGGYVTSYTDITEDRQAEQALEAKVEERTQQLLEANAALEAATRSKTRFLAAASHDLVQPMNAARLFSNALGEEVGDEPRARQLIGQIDRSIQTADRLLRALLDISRLDGGKLVPDNAPFPLDLALAEIANEFEVQARHKGLELVVQPCGLWVETDRGLFVSVLQNLVTNALRYSDSGKVLVGVRRRGPTAEIMVIDQGCGFAQEDAERIFDEFTQLGSAQRAEGLGLGLAIVRRIAAILESEIAVQSEPGRGSCFSLSLPVVEPGIEDEPELRARPVDTASKAATILCIENDPASLAALTELLTRWGYDVCGLSDPAHLPDGLEPALVLLDYRLDEGLTGDAAAQMLAGRLGKLPPAILLTAEDTAETKAAAKAIGAQRMIKPPAPASLRALVASLLGSGA